MNNVLGVFHQIGEDEVDLKLLSQIKKGGRVGVDKGNWACEQMQSKEPLHASSREGDTRKNWGGSGWICDCMRGARSGCDGEGGRGGGILGDSTGKSTIRKIKLRVSMQLKLTKGKLSCLP